MNTLEIVGTISCAILCFLILCWYVFIRHVRNRRKPDRILMISECIQPHFVCKTVPCQHPYYRVISEYNSKARPMPDIEEKPEDSSQEFDELATKPFRFLPEKKRPRFYSQDEYSRASIHGLPRRHSLAIGSRRLSSYSTSSSRRSSDASTASISVTPIYNTVPSLMT